MFRTARQLLRQHRRELAVANVAFYALLAGSMVVAVLVPSVHEAVLRGVDGQLSNPVMAATIGAAYTSGNIPLAATYTFLTNLLVGTVGTITLPSLLVPFFGVAFGVYRAVQWGLIFPPFAADLPMLLPHYLTLVMEGQAYVLAAFAVYLHGRMFLKPARYGLASHRAGYVAGLRATARLYPLVVVVLLVAAGYEAVEVVLLSR